MNPNHLPVAVIGAGPVGLAAAAHLHERHIPFVVFEVGDDVAASMRRVLAVELQHRPRRPTTARRHRMGRPTPPITPPVPSSSSTTSTLALQPEISTGSAQPSRHRHHPAGTDKITTDGRDRAPFVVTTEGPHGFERTCAAVIDTREPGTRRTRWVPKDAWPSVNTRRAI